MAMQWLDDVRQTATLDEAEQLAVRLMQAPFQDVRASYAKIGFDVTAFAARLSESVSDARKARTRRQVAQNRYELESEERRAAVDAAAKWIDQIQLAGRYAKAIKHPLGEALPKLFFTSEVETGTWSQSLDGMAPVLDNVAELGDLTVLGLPADFHAQGVAVFARLREERDDSAYAESARMMATRRLEDRLDEIVEHFEQIVAARDLVMALTGEDLPGLELSLVKAAAAPRAAPRAAPTTPPIVSAPVPSTSVPSTSVPASPTATPLDDTGL